MLVLGVPLGARALNTKTNPTLGPVASAPAPTPPVSRTANTQPAPAAQNPPTLSGFARLQSKHPALVPVIAQAKNLSEQISNDVNKAARPALAKSAELNSHLARLTAYWSGEGDYYTGEGIASTGIHLHQGHCAVDPRIIPYGSTVKIPGVGSFLAVDTGSAVIARSAAKESGHNDEERSALVIDIYFESRRDGEDFAANGPKFASISWDTPGTAQVEAKEGMLADTQSERGHARQL